MLMESENSKSSDQPTCLRTLKDIISQTDQFLVILSSKPYVFEDKLTKYQSV